MVRFDLIRHFLKGPESKEFCLLQMIPKRIEWRDNWEARNKILEPLEEY